MPASCCLLCGSQPGILSCVQSLCLGFPKGHQRLPKWSSGKEPACWCRRHKRYRFILWVGKIPWRRKWQHTPVFLPGKFHGQRSLVEYGPRGSKELDTTECVCTCIHTHTHTRDSKSMSPGCAKSWTQLSVCARAYTHTHTHTRQQKHVPRSAQSLSSEWSTCKKKRKIL